ncbi:MAG: TIGR02147 family protein [Chitinivibrionales bacterium]
MVNIFDYYDYRKYLRDVYEELHTKNPHFSYRYIREKTGMDPGFLVKVFNHQKNLPEKSIPGFIKLLKLKKKRADYFESLVLFGRAKSDIQKKAFFEKLLSLKEPGSCRVDADAYEFYTKWYYTAIRELLGFYPFCGDYAELANLLTPPIKVSEAKKGVQLLERLNFIEKDALGKYRLKNRFITTGELCQSIAVREFQKQTIRLASDSLESIPREKRDISTITATLSEEGFKKLQKRLADFRREILSLANEEQHANCAYHINFQLFPISKQWQEPGQ